jgi:hypothetical protein
MKKELTALICLIYLEACTDHNKPSGIHKDGIEVFDSNRGLADTACFSTEFNKKPFEATLNFRMSASCDMYYFNGYHASLERNKGESWNKPST